jgi:hypothetical protein
MVATKYIVARVLWFMLNSLDAPLMGLTWYMTRRLKYGDATLSQILDVDLFDYLTMSIEFWHCTGVVGKVIFLAFCAYVERPNQSLYPY